MPKTVIQQCIEKLLNSSESDFCEWFADADSLLQLEKEQIKEAYLAGTAQFDNAAPIISPKTPDEYYNEMFSDSEKDLTDESEDVSESQLAVRIAVHEACIDMYGYTQKAVDKANEILESISNHLQN